MEIEGPAAATISAERLQEFFRADAELDAQPYMVGAELDARPIDFGAEVDALLDAQFDDMVNAGLDAMYSALRGDEWSTD